MQCLAVGDCLTKHNFGDVLDLMTLIFIGSVWKYEYGSELAVFPALGVFRTSALHGILKQATASRFHILVNRSFTSHSTIRRYITYAAVGAPLINKESFTISFEGPSRS
jgi:hypothetical protein